MQNLPGLTVPDARAARPDDVHHAIATLATSCDDPAELDELAQLRQLARKLTPPPAEPTLQAFDQDRFRRLVDLAGQALARDLRSHLAEDLATCRTQPLRGASTDWAALRATGHVPISLAGAVGAQSLPSLAETLNLAATRGVGDPASALDPAFVGQLDLLIALVRAKPAPGGGA